jgi:hypothetical protein
MTKLIIIAVGLVFAVIGYRKTWYPLWALLFNVLISVYVSIMTSPQLVDKFPIIRNYLGNYSYAVGVLAATGLVFGLLQLLSFKFFTAVYVVSFPRILNSAGAAVLGFLTGTVAAGFLLFLITITPLSDFSAVKFLAQDRQAPDNVNGVVLGTCDFVHDISLQPDPKGVTGQMEKILTDWRKPQEMKDSKTSVNSEPKKKVEVEE